MKRDTRHPHRSLHAPVSWSWRFKLFAALTTVALLCGCATELERRHSVAQGWQVVTVVKLGGEFVPPLRPADDCRRDVKLTASQSVRFAETVFWSRGFLRHRIVALPEDGAVRVGDRIYANMLDCGIRASSPQGVIGQAS